MLQEQAESGVCYLHRTLLPAQEGEVLELDEVWSFVFRKSEQVWIWLALCRRTRQIVAWMPWPGCLALVTTSRCASCGTKSPILTKRAPASPTFGLPTPRSSRQNSTTPGAKSKQRQTTSSDSTAPCARACLDWCDRPSLSPNVISGTIASSATSS